MSRDKRTFYLVHDMARKLAAEVCQTAPDGYICTVAPPGRTIDQNAKFHAICGDIAKAQIQWAGKPRDTAQWKALLVSGHAVATKEGSDMVPGIEGEYVNLRESTALMSKKRSASLIEYTLAFCAMNDVKIRESEE